MARKPQSSPIDATLPLLEREECPQGPASGPHDDAPEHGVAASRPGSPVHGESAAAGATVLVADGRKEALAALIPALAAESYRVLSAPTGSVALDLFVRERADVVIIHYGVLEASGRELIRHVRALAPAVPIIIQSSALTSTQRREVIRGLDVNAIHNDCDDPERVLELIDCALAATRCFERMRAEQEARSLILAKLCHDLRSPLHVIQGYTEVLRADPAAAAFQDVIAKMAGVADTAIGLVQDYLDLARLEAPGLIIRRERVDIDELVAELHALAGRQIGKRPLRLATSVPLTGAYIYSDGEKLRAILAQLLANAIKFTPAGRIRLTVQAEPERTNFVLADSGPGISEQDIPVLFTPFRQRPDESLAALPGQGIGLAIALRLSALIGASLTVKHGKHGGAVFTLSVPGALIVQTAAAVKRTLH